MVLSNTQIMTHLGFTNAASRNAIINDFLSDGLVGLEHTTLEDVRDAYTSYAKHTDGAFPIQLTTLQKQRLKSLTLWVKDMIRAQLPVQFPNGTTRNQVINTLNSVQVREEMRKEQKRVGESYLDHKFNTKLKSQSQYEKFKQELESTLALIIGSQGVPISYVIWEDAVANYDASLPYEQAVIQAVEVAGPKFAVDARTVHQIILNNVHEDSDAYTYIKPLLHHRDGRRDMIALRERYDSDASRQTIINAAKTTLDTLRYKSERSFLFERFSSRLQKAYDDLESNQRPAHNGDIVDALWPRIQDSALASYVSSLKVDYQRNPRSYKLILQDIASEVANRMKTPFAPGSRNINAVYTRDGECPSNGVHNDDGSIFIGNYTNDKWHSNLVKPY